MEQQVNNYEVRLEELSQLSDEELYLRFWHLAERLVEPLVDYARTHTTPSIERSVLMRMGFTSLEAQPFVQKSIEQGMIGKGCGAILLEYAQKHSTSIRLAFRLISRQAACRLGSHDSHQKRLVRLPTLLHKKLV